MKLIVGLTLLLAGALYAEDVNPNLFAPATPAPVASQKLWRASLTSVAVANVLDVTSSWGKRELNPTLAGANGTFGAKGALLKLAMQGSLVGIEYLVTRGHHSARMYKALAFINFGASAGLTAVAVRNFGIAAPPR